jgi:hypothetical protein
MSTDSAVTDTLLEILDSHARLEHLVSQQRLWHLEGIPHPASGCVICFGV